MTPYNITTGKEYEGTNAQLLAMTSYKQKAFATFIQWKEKGYKVKKGEKGFHIVRYVNFEKKNKYGKMESGIAPRYYTVFNIDQVEVLK